ncbi:hypothetical protein BH09ACT9_BH09ACT9_00160 [soil metagenome]
MTDHKAEAVELIDQCETGVYDGVQNTVTMQPVEALLQAQVHATLYLAEQQRIANLIALSEHAYGRFGNYAGEAGGMGTLFSYPTEQSGNMALRTEFREGLGLA